MNDQTTVTMEWADFRIGDLFEISTGSLVESKKLLKGDIPRISAKSTQNGVVGHFDTSLIDGARHVENCITVNFFGSSGGIFYHSSNVSLEMKVHALKIPNHSLNRYEALFLCTALSKALIEFDYGNQLSSSKLQRGKYFISLPITSEKMPDFKYMAEHIRQLETEHVVKVETYLKATGLQNYELTQAERNILANVCEFKEFKIKELYGKSVRGKRLKSADRINGNLPFVTAGETNSGIAANIGNHVEIFQTGTITIDMFGSAKYRGHDYGADDHIAIVKTQNLTKEAALFVSTAIHKATHSSGKYSYSRNFYASDADDTLISLPVTDSGIPDYDYMKVYITAMYKLVIKNLVEWNVKQKTSKAINK